MRRRTVPLATSFACILLLASCSEGSSDRSPATGTSTPTIAISIEAASGRQITLQVEIADTVQALSTGLTGRTRLPANNGMLFMISTRGPGFWMKDVSIPLSVAFISSCGQVVDIQDMQPLSLDFHDTPQDFRFGLEVNQGWFDRNGVTVGSQVRLPPSLKQEGCP